MSDPAVEGRPSAGSVIHSTIDPKNFSLGLIAASLQKRKFFQVKHLVDVLEIVAKSGLTTRLTPLQIQTLDTPIPDCQKDDKALHGLLMTWFDIFDSAFFGGGLRGLRDRVELQHHGERMAGKGSLGVVAQFQPAGLGKIVLNVDIKKQQGATLEEKFIGSLIHEMVHAFLHFYSCRCSQCDATRPASLGGVGKTQHGPPWIGSIVAVAGTVQARINWQLLVTLYYSIASEMKASDWEPTLEQATGWELSLPLMRSHRTSLLELEKAMEEEEARKLEEARRFEEERRKARDRNTKEAFGLPANATQEQLEQEIARWTAQKRKEEEQKAREKEIREQEREAFARQMAQAQKEQQALARQMAQAQKEQDQREQKQREQERAKREAEQRALRRFDLPADYLTNQDEQEVARQMAQGIQKQNQKAKVPHRQDSQDADPKKDEVVSLKDKVLRRFQSGVTKKKR